MRSLPNLTASFVPTWPILAPLGPSWRQHKLQEASKWSSTGGLDRICGHLGAKRAPRAQPPKNGEHFPANLFKNLIFHSKNKPHGILQRICRSCRLKRKRDIWSKTDPGFPTPGARMTVVYTNVIACTVCTNSLKIRAHSHQT